MRLAESHSPAVKALSHGTRGRVCLGCVWIPSSFPIRRLDVAIPAHSPLIPSRLLPEHVRLAVHRPVVASRNALSTPGPTT